jgi:ATP-dependent DNA helicase RecG
MQMKVADLQRDREMVQQVAAIATPLLQNHPQQARQLIMRWLGGKTRYGSV